MKVKLRIEVDGEVCPVADGKTEYDAAAFIYGFELVTGRRIIITQGTPKVIRSIGRDIVKSRPAADD